MDTFIERIVARKKTSIDTMIYSGLIIGGLILVVAVIPAIANVVSFIKYISLFLYVGIAYGIFFLIKGRNVEFEYAVTNGDLDIDMIIAQRKRKRVFSANCKEFEIMAKLQSPSYDKQTADTKNRIEAVSSMNSPDVFFITTNYKGQKTVVFFEPDERMIDAFKTLIPRKVLL